MLHESRIVRLLAVIVVAVGLVATACGGSEESGSSADDGSSTTSGAAGPAAPSNADIEALTAKVAGGGASFPDASQEPDASAMLRLLVNMIGPFAPDEML